MTCLMRDCCLQGGVLKQQVTEMKKEFGRLYLRSRATSGTNYCHGVPRNPPTAAGEWYGYGASTTPPSGYRLDEHHYRTSPPSFGQSPPSQYVISESTHTVTTRTHSKIYTCHAYTPEEDHVHATTRSMSTTKRKPPTSPQSDVSRNSLFFLMVGRALLMYYCGLEYLSI